MYQHQSIEVEWNPREYFPCSMIPNLICAKGWICALTTQALIHVLLQYQHPFPLRKFIIFNFRAWYHLICIVNCHICHFFNGKSGIRSIYSSVSSLAPLFSNISSQFNEQILPNTCLRHTNSLGHLMVSYNGVTTSNYHVTHTNLTSAFFYFMNYRWMTNNNLANFATQKVRIQFKS